VAPVVGVSMVVVAVVCAVPANYTLVHSTDGSSLKYIKGPTLVLKYVARD